MSELENIPPLQLKVMIAEDHELARSGLSYSLQKKAGLEIVAEAENGQQAVTLASETQPDIILMDIGMPLMDGIAATQEIKSQFPQIKVIMLTSHQDTEEVYASMAAGADAYCMKDIKIDRLVQVLEMVAEGAIWLDPAIARMVVNTLPAQQMGASGGQAVSGKSAYSAELTEREMEVLTLIVKGESNKEIATTLDISPHTVKAHVGSIIQKLAVDDRTQAAVKALRDGLVTDNKVVEA